MSNPPQTRPVRGESVDLTPGLGTRVGIVLPHFGAELSWERLFGLAPWLEQLGYRSAWVRDHLIYKSHAYETGGSRFLDPFITLNSIGMLTRRLLLATTVIPYRHPLVVSQLFGSMAAACGDRIIAGLAAGNSPLTFPAVGMPPSDRWQATRELAQILRLTWSGDDVSYDGKLFRFEHVSINPKPRPDTPIYYSGSSLNAIKRVVEYADGWFPGKSPLATFDQGLAVLHQAGEVRGKRFGLGIIPLISVDRDRETAYRKVNVDGLLAEMRKGAFEGSFERPDDLAGVLIAGSAADCAAELARFVERGVDHVVLDFRLRMKEYEEMVERVATEVLPLVPGLL